MLINNINYLREKYPYIREKLKNIEEDENRSFFLEETKKGDKTLLYKNEEKQLYFHSKYNPIKEAEALIEEYREVKNKNIIFYGTGLGYHIDLLMSENSNNDYYIFEPNTELMECFLSERDLTNKQYKNLKVLSMGITQISREIDKLIELNRKEIDIIELPIHKKIFEKEFEEFNDIFLKTIKEKRSNLATDYNFQRRWIVNSMKNFKDVLNTPNIILEKKNEFKDKPVLLVAAGPSLNDEIENLKYIKENGLAYIVSVGSAVNTLIHNDIYPDAVTSYDPTERNQIVFEKIKEQDIKDIPLIFGSSIGHETLNSYPGKKYHMITSQDKISNYLLEGQGKDVDIVLDAPSIAVVTLQLLAYLGFDNIILVGQNLAYLGSDEHSEGIHYSKILSEEKLENALKVESVYGEEILTTDGYNRMRNQMEYYISALSKGRVINTTKNGAKIKGAEFLELEKLIKDKLTERAVNEEWLEGKKEEYDKKKLERKIDIIDKELKASRKSIKEYNSNLERILLLVKNKNFNQMEKAYQNLNINIEELESNVFFTTFILQLNRVQHKLLSDDVKISKNEKNIYKRNIDLLDAYRRFIDKCTKDIEFILPIYEEMKDDIYEYINEQ